MEKKTYHHGDLRNAMIDAGISIINEEGLKNLSLRKVAKACEVSHAAPYKHFENKEALINAIKTHIADDFATKLKSSEPSDMTDENMLLMFGRGYIQYFMDHPSYYKFLFNQPHFHITISQIAIKCDDFAPFSMFINTVKDIMRTYKVPEEEIVTNIVFMLSIVDGLTSILISDNVTYQGDVMQLVTKILTEKINL